MEKQQVLEALKKVMDPELERSLVDLGMIKHVGIEGGTVELIIALTVEGCPLKEQIHRETESALKLVDGFKELKLKMTTMAPEELGALKQKLGREAAAKINPNSSQTNVPEHIAALKNADGRAGKDLAAEAHQEPDHGGINRLAKQAKCLIAVTSGKGGVGKSSVTSMLAASLARRGFKVGILDADITGPSIARIFGTTDRPKVVDEKSLEPVTSKSGVKLLSMNLMITDENAPVIWRGPLINGAIRQMYSQGKWEDCDVMLIDLPPGTSDANLTVFQSLPLDGVIIVTSPQDLVKMIVHKAVRMATALRVKVVGLVENFAYVKPPGMLEPYYLFGTPKGEEVAREMEIAFLGSLPVDPALTKACDNGTIHEVMMEPFEALVEKVLESEVLKGKLGISSGV